MSLFFFNLVFTKAIGHYHQLTNSDSDPIHLSVTADLIRLPGIRLNSPSPNQQGLYEATIAHSDAIVGRPIAMTQY